MADETNYNDPTELEKINYNQEQVSPEVKKHTKNVRHKMYGRYVRESIAQAIEVIDLIAHKALNISEKTQKRQNHIEEQFDDVIANVTVDSEVILARPSIYGTKHKTLGKRLDYMEAESEKKKTVRYEEFSINTQPKFYDVATDKYYLDKEFTQEYTVDDAPLLKKIHDEVINKNLTISDKNCHFVIKSCVDILIPENYSNVGGTFHIDSKCLVDTSTADRVFKNFVSIDDTVHTITDPEMLKLLRTRLKKDEYLDLSDIPLFQNVLLTVKDKNDIVGIRSKYGTSSYPKTDLFTMDSSGISYSDCGWDFKDVTEISYKKINTTISDINLGSIILNNNVRFGKVKKPVFESTRSRSKVSVSILLEDGVIQTDNDAHTNGVVIIRDCGLTQVNESSLPPNKVVKNEKGETLGTYSLGVNSVDGLKLKGVKAIGKNSQGYWGFMGSNFVKNLEIEDCNLNRVDVHFYLRNLDVKNTEIGDFGILFSGSGKARLDNVKSYSMTAIQTRDDFGCYWDGDIIINDLDWFIPENEMKVAEANLISFSDVLNFDHGYDFIFGRNIYVNNVNINFSEPNESIYLNLIRNTYNKALNVRKVFYPDNIVVRQVKVNGRKTGVNQYLAIKDPENAANYSKDKTLYYNQRHYVNVLRANANYIFEDIDTLNKDADNANQLDACIRLMPSDVSKYTENSLLPKIVLEGIPQVYMAQNRARADIEINNSDTSLIIGYFGGDALSRVRLNGGSIQPDLAKLTDVIQMTGGLFEMNAVIVKPIKVTGSVKLDDTMSKLGFFTTGANATAVTFKYGNYTGVDLDPRILSHMDSFASKSATDKVFSELKSNGLTRYWEATGNGYTI